MTEMPMTHFSIKIQGHKNITMRKYAADIKVCSAASKKSV